MLMMEANLTNLTRLEKILADGGYTGDEFELGVLRVTCNECECDLSPDSEQFTCSSRQSMRLFGFDATVEVVLRSELHTFVVLPKRWIVERSFSWLDNCRRLWKNCERFFHTSLQMVNLAFISLLLRRY